MIIVLYYVRFNLMGKAGKNTKLKCVIGQETSGRPNLNIFKIILTVTFLVFMVKVVRTVLVRLVALNVLRVISI